MIVYEIYKNVRDAGWRCLLECGINELPTNLSKICKHFNIEIIKNSSLKQNKLLENERAENMMINSKWYIIVNDNDSMAIQRYSIAHEIGHILLGNDASEYEAERFAIGILAPACVLWGMNIHFAEDIAQVCNISITSARIRAKRMEALYQRNKFLTSPLERQVFQQFLDFINSKKQEQ